MSAKNKIYIVLAVWILLCLSMQMYFFKIFGNGNSQVVAKIAEQKKELAFFKVEEASFKLSRQDLEQVKKESIQPEGLFNKDITFVDQIKFLEDLGERMNIKLTIAGISGTVKNASKAKTTGDIVTIPYSLNVVAPFPKVISFLEVLENLDFITSITSVNISSASEGNVNAAFPANFYLKRQ